LIIPESITGAEPMDIELAATCIVPYTCTVPIHTYGTSQEIK
jgi:hypothetical protein